VFCIYGKGPIFHIHTEQVKYKYVYYNLYVQMYNTLYIFSLLLQLPSITVIKNNSIQYTSKQTCLYIGKTQYSYINLHYFYITLGLRFLLLRLLQTFILLFLLLSLPTISILLFFFSMLLTLSISLCYLSF
jgi:hypothetical protein